ncbi:Ras-GEF domain-containing member 1C [Batrachochytrium dendrobatidis]|nr:Ras-GEF domain-containing member 1C [Batrachochytrium dendrobatidis]
MPSTSNIDVAGKPIAKEIEQLNYTQTQRPIMDTGFPIVESYQQPSDTIDFPALTRGFLYPVNTLTMANPSLMTEQTPAFIFLNLVSLDLLDAKEQLISSFAIHLILKYSHNPDRSSFSFIFLSESELQSEYRFISPNAYDIFTTLGKIISIIIKLKQKTIGPQSLAENDNDLVSSSQQRTVTSLLALSHQQFQPIAQQQSKASFNSELHTQNSIFKRSQSNLGTLKHILTSKQSVPVLSLSAQTDSKSINSTQKEGSFFSFLSGNNGLGFTASRGTNNDAVQPSIYNQQNDKPAHNKQSSKSRKWFIRRSKSTGNFGQNNSVLASLPTTTAQLPSISTLNLKKQQLNSDKPVTSNTVAHIISPCLPTSTLSQSIVSTCKSSPLPTPPTDSFLSSSQLFPADTVAMASTIETISPDTVIAVKPEDTDSVSISTKVSTTQEDTASVFTVTMDSKPTDQTLELKSQAKAQSAQLADVLVDENSNQNSLDATPVLRVLDMDQNRSLSRSTINGELQPVSGTVEALVDCLFSEPLSGYADAFLLTFRLFTNASKVLDCLTARYIGLSHNPMEATISALVTKQLPVVLMHRIFSLLKKWITQYSYDFYDPVADKKLKDLVHIIQATNEKSYVSSLVAIMDANHEIQQDTLKYTPSYRSSTLERPSVCESMNLTELRDALKSDVDILNLPSRFIARHLTQKDWAMFKAIHISEFVHFISPDSCFDTHMNTRDSRTTNLTAFIQRFNQVGFWVSTVICSYEDLKLRTKALSKLIRVAQHCFNFGNYNTSMAVLSGLSASPVYRLKKTFAGLSPRVMDMLTEIETCFDFKCNYVSYRNTEAVSKTAIIPFLGLIIKDISSIYEINANCLSNGLVNFEKYWKLCRRISSVTSYQSWPHIIPPSIDDVEFDEYLASTVNDAQSCVDFESVSVSEVSILPNPLLVASDVDSSANHSSSTLFIPPLYSHILPYLSPEQLTIISRALEPPEDTLSSSHALDDAKSNNRSSRLLHFFENMSGLAINRRSQISNSGAIESDSDDDMTDLVTAGSASNSGDVLQSHLIAPLSSPPTMSTTQSNPGSASSIISKRLRLIRRPLSLSSFKFSSSLSISSTGNTLPSPLNPQPSFSIESVRSTRSSDADIVDDSLHRNVSLEVPSFQTDTAHAATLPSLIQMPLSMHMYSTGASSALGCLTCPSPTSSVSDSPQILTQPPASPKLSFVSSAGRRTPVGPNDNNTGVTPPNGSNHFHHVLRNGVIASPQTLFSNTSPIATASLSSEFTSHTTVNVCQSHTQTSFDAKAISSSSECYSSTATTLSSTSPIVPSILFQEFNTATMSSSSSLSEFTVMTQHLEDHILDPNQHYLDDNNNAQDEVRLALKRGLSLNLASSFVALSNANAEDEEDYNEDEKEVIGPVTPVMLDAQPTVVEVEFGDPRLWPQRRLSQPVIILDADAMGPKEIGFS